MRAVLSRENNMRLVLGMENELCQSKLNQNGFALITLLPCYGECHVNVIVNVVAFKCENYMI